jgi:hypothetical protein
MRARILAVVLASVAPGAGCDSVHSVAARAGIAGFEARCEASLPATRIEVVAAPVVYATDRTRSWRELTAMGDDMAPTQRAVGLTTAKLGDTVAVETSGIEDQSTARMRWPSVRVELTATPMTVYIGRERGRSLSRRCRAARAEARRRLSRGARAHRRRCARPQKPTATACYIARVEPGETRNRCGISAEDRAAARPHRETNRRASADRLARRYDTVRRAADDARSAGPGY